MQSCGAQFEGQGAENESVGGVLELLETQSSSSLNVLAPVGQVS